GVNGKGLPMANRLLRNEGNGRFIDVSAAMGITGTNTWSTSATFIDYDRDGDLDLFVCNYVQWSKEIDLQVDYRLPSVGRAYGPPMSFAGSFPTLYRNDAGKFTDVSEPAGVQIKNRATGLPMAKSLGVSPVDLDNDGWIDLVVANDTVQNFVFHNNQDGTFTEMGGRSGVAYDTFGSTRGAMGIDTGRFHDDDKLAISIGNFANEMTAFYVASRDPLFFSDEALNVGIGDPTRSLLTFGVFFFDYDLNGYLDLLTANGHIEPEIEKVHANQSYAQPVQLFWNTGQSGPENEGTGESGFRRVSADSCGADLHQPIVGRGSAFADIDGDGDQDVLVTQLNGPAKLFRNDQKLGHSWVRVKLMGKKSNRDAIGALVKVRVGNRVFSQQVMPTRGYLSQSELPVTIGLGKAQKIDDVQIFWPDGTRETGVSLKLNTLNTITQR
ncbi:MAG: CRTAC1 family protein, partial [Limisphaerales bacterium]